MGEFSPKNHEDDSLYESVCIVNLTKPLRLSKLYLNASFYHRIMYLVSMNQFWESTLGVNIGGVGVILICSYLKNRSSIMGVAAYTFDFTDVPSILLSNRIIQQPTV